LPTIRGERGHAGLRRKSGSSIALLVLLGGGLFALARFAPSAVSAADTVVYVDPARLSFEGFPPWVDPRWIDRLEEIVGSTPPFAVDDRAALEGLRTELIGQPYVRSIARLDADRRDGLCLELALREPVACVPAGDTFLLVSSDAVVLPGRWNAPPRCGPGFLPVLGPIEDAELFAFAEPGDWLAEEAHLDALDVALSLADHLSDDARRTLGRCVIDASRARQASIDEPGVRLLLEERRLCLFGRRPSTPEPGELPVARKWAALEKGLALLDDPGRGWDLIDCRWDKPDLRTPQVAHVDEPSRWSPRERSSRPNTSAGVELRSALPRVR